MNKDSSIVLCDGRVFVNDLVDEPGALQTVDEPISVGAGWDHIYSCLWNDQDYGNQYLSLIDGFNYLDLHHSACGGKKIFYYNSEHLVDALIDC